AADFSFVWVDRLAQQRGRAGIVQAGLFREGLRARQAEWRRAGRGWRILAKDPSTGRPVESGVQGVGGSHQRVYRGAVAAKRLEQKGGRNRRTCHCRTACGVFSARENTQTRRQTLAVLQRAAGRRRCTPAVVVQRRQKRLRAEPAVFHSTG